MPAVAWIVEILARLVALKGDTPLAARLWAGSELLREQSGLTLPEYWAASLSDAVRSARLRSGDGQRFDAIWEEGRRMPSHELMALAKIAAVGLAFAD